MPAPQDPDALRAATQSERLRLRRVEVSRFVIVRLSPTYRNQYTHGRSKREKEKASQRETRRERERERRISNSVVPLLPAIAQYRKVRRSFSVDHQNQTSKHLKISDANELTSATHRPPSFPLDTKIYPNPKCQKPATLTRTFVSPSSHVGAPPPATLHVFFFCFLGMSCAPTALPSAPTRGAVKTLPSDGKRDRRRPAFAKANLLNQCIESKVNGHRGVDVDMMSCLPGLASVENFLRTMFRDNLSVAGKLHGIQIPSFCPLRPRATEKLLF